MSNPIGWFEIYVGDMDRARSFYETVFEIKLEKMGDPTGRGVELWGFPSDFGGYGATGALVKLDEIAPGSNSTIIYFMCDDCAIEESRVDAAGGRVEQSKFSIDDYGFCSLVKDSEGNTIGLHSEK